MTRFMAAGACSLLAVASACAADRTSDAGVESLASLVTRSAPRSADDKLLPPLRARLSAAAADQPVPILVELRDQLDLGRASSELTRARADRQSRRRFVVGALERIAATRQRVVREGLSEMLRDGRISSYRSLAIVNGFTALATPSAIAAIARLEDVARIDSETERSSANDQTRSSSPHRSQSTWAIEALGVDSAWRRGLVGTGVVVGIIDPGASDRHEQLRENFRGGAASWHDPTGELQSPSDVAPGHGTSVLSAAVGQNVGDVTTGVAPGAQWIACAGLTQRRYNNIATTACADWMLRTGRPDVLVIPWLLPTNDCDLSLHRIVSAWRMADIVVVFAAGNHGPRAGTSRPPANYIELHPDGAAALAVGGIERDGTAYARSSRGPSACGGVYPTLAAPAVDLPVAIPLTRSSYLQTSGTSVAAGYVAGAAALLRQHDRAAPAFVIERALREGAVDVGTSGPDNTFGFGRLSVPRALRSLSQQRTAATATALRAGFP